MRIYVLLVDVIDQVGRGSIDRGRKVAHECCNQAGKEEPEQSYRHICGQNLWQDALEVGFGE